MSKSFAMAGAAHRLARDARPRPPRALRRVQGLHDDLLVGAVGDPRPHRAAGARPGAGPVARRSSRPTSRDSTGSSRTGPTGSTWVRPRGGSIGFPRLTVPGVRIDDWAAQLVEATGVLLLPGSVVRPSGQPLPARVRADGPARGARPARGVRDVARSAEHAVASPGRATPSAMATGGSAVTRAIPPRRSTIGRPTRPHAEGDRDGDPLPRLPRPAATAARVTSASPDPKLERHGAASSSGSARCAVCRSDSPATARSASCTALNEILADSMVLYSLYKKHHWLVAGPTFYQLHLLFDKHAEEQARAHRPPRRARPEPRAGSPSATRVMPPS